MPATAQSLLVEGSATATLSFTSDLGASPAPKRVRLTTSNSQSVPFQIASQTQPPAHWLLTPQVSSSATPADITFLINSHFLSAGTYQTVLKVLSTTPGYQEAVITLNLTVGSGGGSIGTLIPSTTSLTLASDPGLTPTSQSVTITSASTTSFTVSTQVNAPIGYNWLSVSASSFGVGPGAPSTLTITPIPGSMSAGSYTGSITLTPTSGAATSIFVTFNYGVAGVGTLTATPSPLVLDAPLGGSTTGQLTVSHIADSSVAFLLSVSFQTGTTSWLTPETTYGSSTPLAISFTASAVGLTAGTHYGTVTLTPAAGGASTTVQVQFNVGGPGTGLYGLYPQTLSFSADVGTSAQQAAVYIQDSVGSFSATARVTTPVGGAWLTVSPTASATSPATLTVTANPTGLGVGTYTGAIAVTYQNGVTEFVNVTLNVGVIGTYPLAATPAALAFSATAGSGPSATQILSVTGSTSTPVQFTANAQVGWLSLSQTSGFTPATITVQANSSLLTAGTHQGSILITGGGTSTTVQVLFVIGTKASTLSVNPSTPSLGALYAGTSVSSLVSVNSTTGATIGFSAQVFGTSWLSINSTGASTPTSLTLSASPHGLASGVYGGFVIVQPLDGSTPQVVAVTLNVGGTAGGASNGVVSVSPASLTFSITPGGPTLAPRVLTVTSLSGQSVTFTSAATTESGLSWLRVDPASASADLSFPVVVTVNPSDLSAGTYQGAIIIAAKGLVATIPVSLNISGPPITVAPSSLPFTTILGGAAPPAQTVSVSSATATSFTASPATTSGGNWLSVFPTTGSSPAELTVSANPTGLAAGTYAGQVYVLQAGAVNPKVVNVALTVIGVTTAQLVKISGDGQTAFLNQAFAQPLVVQVNDQQGRPVSGIQVSFSVASGSATLGSTTATTDAQGRASTTVQTGSAAGPIVITAGVSSLSATFNLSSRVPGPAVTAASFISAASGQQGVVAGSLTTIQGSRLAPGIQGCVEAGVVAGPLPTTLAGVTVAFGAHLAPIFSVCNVDGREQARVQAPWELGVGAVRVQITVGAGTTIVEQVPVVAAQPGIFETAGTDGRRYAVLARPDGSFVTPLNPARRGELIRIYATGLGPVLPRADTNRSGVPGQAVYYSVVVGVNNSGARVVSAEYAQNMIGIYIVTIELPADTFPGQERPLELFVQLPDGRTVQSNGSRFAIQ
ncbi:MAG: Ig-like domain-containing protein [Acidobacteriota bacterium]